MTVQNTNRKDVYLTNGTTIYWPYTFEIFTTNGSDIALYETNLTTGETKLIDTNFALDIINKRIKYPRTGSPRPAGYKITVARITERTQGIDLETQSFDPKNMERGLDKLTAMVQEIDETVSRAAVADISQQGVNFTFPSPVGGKVIGWNAEGTGLINLDNTTLGIEAQMLAATEAAQTAADKVDNLVSTAFEEDGTTVKKATHAGSADLLNYETQLIVRGYLTNNQTGIGGFGIKQVQFNKASVDPLGKFNEDNYQLENIPAGNYIIHAHLKTNNPSSLRHFGIRTNSSMIGVISPQVSFDSGEYLDFFSIVQFSSPKTWLAFYIDTLPEDTIIYGGPSISFFSIIKL